jgi:putative ABC transport system ATP-binding protein
VMVTHDPGAAAVADRTMFLADGELVRDIGRSSPSQVLEAMNDISTVGAR